MKKKVLNLFLAVSMVLSLAACGAKEDASGDSADKKETTESNETLKISMGTNNPYGFLDEKEEPAGFVVDLTAWMPTMALSTPAKSMFLVSR